MTTPDYAGLSRPIVGIENRTAQEVFGIMSDRMRTLLERNKELERERDEARKQAIDWSLVASRVQKKLDAIRRAIKVKGGDEHSPTWDAYEAACRAIDKHRARAEAAEARVKELERGSNQLRDKLHCMCGSPIDHSAWEGHTPVSVYDYSLDQERSRAEAAEARLAEAQKVLGMMLKEHDILSGNFGGVMDPKRKRPDRWPTAAESARRVLDGENNGE